MKSGKLIKYLNVISKFDERLRLVEHLISVSDSKNKMQSIYSNEKCKSSYNKIDFAQLFYVLMDEGLLFFDATNEKSNRSKFQFFLENNFTYAGDEGRQSRIKSISRQFSECKGYTYKEKQIAFLEDFIRTMQDRKRRIESW